MSDFTDCSEKVWINLKSIIKASRDWGKTR